VPFKSKSQQRYFYANREKLKAQGVDVNEWSDSTDFKNLPEKAAGLSSVFGGLRAKFAFPMIPHKALIAGDIAGLGILAEPTIHKWISGPDAVSEREKDIAEIGGLGVLAATQIPHLTGHVAEGHAPAPMPEKISEFWATEYVKMAAVPLAPVRGRARRSPNPGVTTMLNPSLTPDTSGV
jgi:hypothetical protein